MYNITFIQLFVYNNKFENSSGDYDIEKSYSANIVINDRFIVQASGDLDTCDFSIPHSVDQFWNSEDDQDQAYETISDSDLKEHLEKSGFENNLDWLLDNCDDVDHYDYG